MVYGMSQDGNRSRHLEIFTASEIDDLFGGTGPHGKNTPLTIFSIKVNDW